MDRFEREREAFVFELRRRIRHQKNLTHLSTELARVQTSVTTHLNDLSRYPSIPRAARESIFREVFATMKMEAETANRTGKEPAVA